MCGIYGCVVVEKNKKWDEGILRALTWANRERGTDSVGFFVSDGTMTKRALDPAKALSTIGVTKWLRNAQKSTWFVAGHTRFATRGAVNRRNAHPFRYGRIIGSHNGMVEAPTRFKVDSEVLFYRLNKAHGDYQKGLGKISGYWGLSWFDGTHFYLMCNQGELAVTVYDGVLYYSSSLDHLQSTTGSTGRILNDGEVIRISADGEVISSSHDDSEIAAFVSTAPDYWSNTYPCGTYRNYKHGGRGTAGRKETESWSHEQYGHNDTSGGSIRHYDQDWMNAWSSYCDELSDSAPHNKTISQMSDEEYVAYEDGNRYAG